MLRTRAAFITKHVVLPSDTVKLLTTGLGCGFGVVVVATEEDEAVVVTSSLHCAPVRTKKWFNSYLILSGCVQLLH